MRSCQCEAPGRAGESGEQSARLARRSTPSPQENLETHPLTIPAIATPTRSIRALSTSRTVRTSGTSRTAGEQVQVLVDQGTDGFHAGGEFLFRVLSCDNMKELVSHGTMRRKKREISLESVSELQSSTLLSARDSRRRCAGTKAGPFPSPSTCPGTTLPSSRHSRPYQPRSVAASAPL